MPQPTPLTPWQQYKLGDPEAFAGLYGEYVQVLYAQGLRVTPDAALVKDCIHDLFVELWHNRKRIPDDVVVPDYLIQALRTGLAARLPNPAGPAPAEAEATLPHAPLPVERNPVSRRQPVVSWPVPLPVGRPEVMSLPGYGEAAPHEAGPFALLAKAVKALQGLLSLH